MSDNIIEVKNLCKNFKLYKSPKHRLIEALHPFRKKYHDDYQAIKDISFQIKKGECVGILGKNGAGKSTLLKLLTGVLMPTSGTVEIKGRIAALLELGSGFNPDLTGLENIYFQGAILGFVNEEMDKKIQEIVDFADIGEYINQPVKSYSSGMFARLAFSIAINVDPDILIIDEALSVGDFSFQQKCFRRLNQMKEAKKNILFVSHDTSAIQAFCDYCIYIKSGTLKAHGPSSEVINLYYASQSDENEKSISKTSADKVSDFGKGKARIKNFSAVSAKDNGRFYHGEKATFLFEIECIEDLDIIGVGVSLRDKRGRDILYINNYLYDFQIKDLSRNDVIEVSFEFNFPNLTAGKYSLSPAVCEGVFDLHEQQHWIFDAQEIIVQAGNSRMSEGVVCIPEAIIKFQKLLEG